MIGLREGEKWNSRRKSLYIRIIISFGSSWKPIYIRIKIHNHVHRWMLALAHATFYEKVYARCSKLIRKKTIKVTATRIENNAQQYDLLQQTENDKNGGNSTALSWWEEKRKINDDLRKIKTTRNRERKKMWRACLAKAKKTIDWSCTVCIV